MHSPATDGNRRRTIIITGASDGIGAAAARQLAGPGTRLVLVGRSPDKTRRVAAELQAEHHVVDFARLEEVRDLADAISASCERIDVLANNAGGMFSGPTATQDGFELSFQVNHLAPYLLTHQLMDRLLASRASVVSTASIAARAIGNIDLDDVNGWESFDPNRAYGSGKLANILFTKGLHERFHHRGLNAVAFHPGIIRTNFASATTSYMRWVYQGGLSRLLTSAERGGARLAHFVNGHPGSTWVPGQYYSSPTRIGRTHRQAYDPAIVRGHWERSAALLGISW